MDPSDNNKYDVNSDSTIVLGKNDKSPDEYGITNKSHRELKICNSYKAPQRLSENYLYLIKTMANELVNCMVTDSKWIVWCSFKLYK